MTSYRFSSLLVGIALALGNVTPQAVLAQERQRPNILFIYTDDHSHRTVGCYPESYAFVRTPNIDALAERGVRFKHAFIGTWCMPSRATLLTGHYQHGVQSMRMEGKYPGSRYDPAQCPFWPSVFRQHGYQTAHIGKWHTGTDTGFGRDWDHQIVWNRPRHPGNAGNYYKDQLIETNGDSAKMVTGYSTDNYTDWALDYLNGNGRDPDKPWYLWLCYGAVHGPFTPAVRHQQAYPDASVPIPPDIYPPRAGKPAYMQSIAHWFRGDDGQPHLKGRRRATGEQSPGRGIHGSTLDDWIRQYHQGVLALDEAVGKLIATLKSTGQYDNTLIVFTSDQGFAWGQHGFRAKVAPYDATIRSPLIVSMPSRLPEGKVCATPVGGPDLVPTFFKFAGIDLPWEMHGRDLSPLLKNPAAPWTRPLLFTFTGRQYGSDTNQIPTDPAVLQQVGGVPWWVSLHDGRYKYIRTLVEGEIEELYDLDNDPEELHNLALKKEQAPRLLNMRDKTVAELKRTKAGFVETLPKVGSKNVALGEVLRPDFGISATFSIVAVDPQTGECGAAVASKYPDVGKVVPYVRSGVGAFCTQHWHNPAWGAKALDLLEAGHNSETVLGMLVQDDPRRDKRQLAIIDMQGRAANRNPSDADASGIYWGAMSGRFYACQGNTLAGRDVVVALAKAYEETKGSLTDRLVAALVAADCAGGDHRGRLAAGVVVAKKDVKGHWFELYTDKSDDAVMDLLKKYVELEHAAKGDWKPGQPPFQHPCPQRATQTP